MEGRGRLLKMTPKRENKEADEKDSRAIRAQEIQKMGEPQASIQYLKEPHIWPHWPAAPMRHETSRETRSGMKRTAVVFDAGDDPVGNPLFPGAGLVLLTDATVFDGSKLGQRLRGGEGRQMTAEQIIDDGWRMD